MLTLVMRTKNRAHHLRHSLPSLAAQVNRDFHLVLFDYGGSNPAETRQLALAAGFYPEQVALLVAPPSDGPWHNAYAINLAMRYVTSDYACIINPDNIFPPSFTEHVLSNLAKDALVQCRRRNLTREASNRIYALDRPAQYNEWRRYSSLMSDVAEGEVQAFSLERFWRLGGYDERYVGWGADDNDFAVRMVASGCQKVWINHRKCATLHMHHSGRPKKDYMNANRGLYARANPADFVRNEDKTPGQPTYAETLEVLG